nr:MAG TPA: hypothetical protein [Caudoviricetes sp.]
MAFLRFPCIVPRLLPLHPQFLLELLNLFHRELEHSI